MELVKSAFAYDKFGNANKKYLNETLAFEGITDNTGTVSRAIDHTNNLQYDYTYDSTDRLISSTVTNSNNNQRKVMFEYNFDLNNNMSKFITLTPTGHNKVFYTNGKDNLLMNYWKGRDTRTRLISLFETLQFLSE